MKLADLNLADEALNRTIKQVRGRELPWFCCYFFLIILAYVPYFWAGHAWLLWLPVMVIPLIYQVAKKQSRLTKAMLEALPADSQEELKRREIYVAEMQKKYAMIIIPVMVLYCVGFLYFCRHHFEKDRKATEQAIRMQQQQQRSVPARK